MMKRSENEAIDLSLKKQELIIPSEKRPRLGAEPLIHTKICKIQHCIGNLQRQQPQQSISGQLQEQQQYNIPDLMNANARLLYDHQQKMTVVLSEITDAVGDLKTIIKRNYRHVRKREPMEEAMDET